MTRQVTAVCLSSSALGDARDDSLALLSAHIARTHSASRTLLVNLSERPYHDEERLLQGCSLLTFRFPGLPSPPLSLLLVIASAVARWVDADARHHVYIHCQLGLGRTLLSLAALLLYTHAVDDISQAALYLQQRLSSPTPLSSLLLPSQRRYLTYLDHITSGQPPTAQRVASTHSIRQCTERQCWRLWLTLRRLL